MDLKIWKECEMYTGGLNFDIQVDSIVSTYNGGPKYLVVGINNDGTVNVKQLSKCNENIIHTNISKSLFSVLYYSCVEME